MGGFDLFTAKMNESGLKPENMGHPVNSSRDDIYFLQMKKMNCLKMRS
jgi:hypothetical protein